MPELRSSRLFFFERWAVDLLAHRPQQRPSDRLQLALRVASDVNGSALPVTIDSGKCIGGSSSINGMVWYRPTSAELDAIEGLGNPGWNSTTLFPVGVAVSVVHRLTFLQYMKAIEHNIPPSEAQRADGANLVPSFHGFDGPVNVLDDLVGSCCPNSPGARSAAYSLLYPRSKQQKTLTVLAEHKVAKVIFDKNMKATGLQFAPANGGAFSIVNAKIRGSYLLLEVWLFWNVLGVLSKVGIKQLVDLPGVGLNLQDQPGTALSASVQTANVSDTLLIDNFFSAICLGLLFGNKSARLSQQLQDNIAARAKAAVAAGTEVNLAGATKLFTTWPLTPLSRGHIHIHTSDPFASPRITPRFLSDDFDVETGVKIAQKARDLYTTFPFQPIISEVVIDAVPANATDDDWAKWYRDTSFVGASHWLGSCAMRPRASGGVVSPTLEVYGTSGLRVVDASVIPFQVTSHTMSTIYAARLYSEHAQETFESFTQRYVQFFNQAEDVFEVQRGLNNCFAHDLVPAPSVIEAAVRAARRVDDFATAVRIFNGVKVKVENKKQYQQYLDELKGVREELGITLEEELYPDWEHQKDDDASIVVRVVETLFNTPRGSLQYIPSFVCRASGFAASNAAQYCASPKTSHPSGHADGFSFRVTMAIVIERRKANGRKWGHLLVVVTLEVVDRWIVVLLSNVYSRSPIPAFKARKGSQEKQKALGEQGEENKVEH
ncbi:cytochrome c oxidase subunit VA-domain-containing protein [Mycena olivaceomarginata]|nr:cytochrome c oxidase subunit VA-domain-containing protein [Mycena olivaceomarginata]